MEDPKLTIRHSENMGDWYVIERAEHDGRIWLEMDPDGRTGSVRCSSRFSDADVEGDSAEMLAIADAIVSRTSASFKRCAVNVTGEVVSFRSPRNSQMPGLVSYATAVALAELIYSQLDKKIE